MEHYGKRNSIKQNTNNLWEILENSASDANILHDPNILYHGIGGFDITRFESILKHGILAARSAEASGIKISRNFIRHNGLHAISVVESPSINNTYNHGAYGMYVRHSIGFAINDTSSVPDRPDSGSGIPGERYVSGSIPPDRIVGVTVPKETLDVFIGDLPVGLAKSGYATVEDRALAVLDDIQAQPRDSEKMHNLLRQFDKSWNNDSVDYLERARLTEEIVAEIDSWTAQIIARNYEEKVGRKLTLRAALKQFTPAGIGVYDSETGDKIDL